LPWETVGNAIVPMHKLYIMVKKEVWAAGTPSGARKRV